MLIAHDLGTSGNKASLHTDSGELLAAVTVRYPVHFAEGGVAEQNPADWWNAVVRATRELLDRTGADPAGVAGLVVSGQMNGAVLLDGDYAPVRPAIIWADTRSTAQVEQLLRHFSQQQALQILGHQLSSSYSLSKLMWVRDHEPEAWARVRHFGLAKDFIVQRLTGRLHTDPSDASSTNAYDIRAGDWSEPIIAAAGLPRSIFPEVVDSTQVVGTLTPDAAGALGLPVSTRVVMGGGDGPIAAVGAGVVAPQDPPFVCLGTSSWISFATAEPAAADPRLFTFSHVVPGRYVPTATMQAAGGAVEWASEVLGAPVPELTAQAAKVRAADEGLFFLPYLLGERSPWFNPDAAGSFVGLARHHTPGHLMRAVLEGVALNLLLCLDAFRASGLQSPTVDAIGGGAANDLWLQLMADAWGVTVRRRTVVEEANSLGAAVVGAVGLGLADFAAARTLSQVTASFEPDPARTALYRQAADVFTDAYRRLEPWFAHRKPA
ncbi:MAG: xylulokinase [Propionicimonas sp.]